MKPNIGILIATRNRSRSIENLLNSLNGNQVSEIVISASGEDLSAIVHKYSKDLPLKYVLGEAGQIRQKLNGISIMSEELDWVIFSDDDLEFNELFLNSLVKKLEELPSDVIGVGMNLQVTSKPKQNSIHKIIKWIFRIQVGRPGSVNSNGECVEYLQSKTPIETDWLNGASVWRRRIVQDYCSVFPETRYAAYEDAFFSFAASRRGRLIYFPELKIRYSSIDAPTKMNSLIFISVNYWKLLFVVNFKLSFSKSIISTIGASIIFLGSKSATEPFMSKLNTVLHLMKTILFVTLSRKRMDAMLRFATKELKVE